MIVDCHTHWGMGWEARDKGDPTRWIEVLDRHGVGAAIFMGHEGLVNMSRTSVDNNRLAAIASRYPERLIPAVTAWPQQGEAGVAELERCASRLGAKAFKFHPWLQGFSTADPVLSEMCELAAHKAMPVIFHDGTPCYSLPDQIAGLARRHPRTQFVLGHSGLIWHWRSAIQAAQLPNMWLCLCGPPLRGIEVICQKTSPERLLWGSDFGFGWADLIEYRLKLLQRAHISDKLLEMILGQNPVRLFGLQ